MLKKILYNQEYIILKDSLSYLVGPVKLPATIIVTNHRLLIMPHNGWGQRLGFHPRNVNWTDLKSLTLGFLGRNLHIKDHNEAYSLWGSSAKVLYQLLQKLRESKPSLDSPSEQLNSDRIAFSSEIQVHGLAGLTVTGHLFIRQKGLSLQYQLLEPHNVHLYWDSLTSIEYKPISQTLKLSIDETTITLQGNEAQLLYHIFEIFRLEDTYVDCIWSCKWGSPQKNGSGYVFLGRKSLYFLPCGLHSSLSDAAIQSIPCSAIQYLRLNDTQIVLVTSSNAQWTLKVDTPLLWLGHHQRLLIQYWSTNSTQPKHHYCSHLSTEHNAFTLGYLTCTNEEVVFSPNGSLEKIHIPSHEVIKLNQRSSRLSLRHQITPATFEFESEYAAKITNDIIEPLISPMSVSETGESRPMEQILGNIKQLNIFLDGSKQASLSKVYIEDQQKLIKIKTTQYESIVFLPSQIEVDIDIISESGHYGFKAAVVHNHLNNSDSKGIYGLVLRPIRSLRAINQRTAFRVPADEEIAFSVELPKFILDQEMGKLINLSSGGCQFEYKPKKQNPLQVLQKDDSITLQLPIEIIQVRKKENRRFAKKIVQTDLIKLDAKIRQIRQKEGSKFIIFGVQFVDVNYKTEHRLLRKILKLERKINRERKKNEDNLNLR